MACFFWAVALLLGAEPTSRPAGDATNAARALLETTDWVEVKDNHGDLEIRALAADEEPKAEQVMRDYHDRYQKAANSYREHEKKYTEAISQLNRQYLDRQEPITVEDVSQYFRHRRKLKGQLTARSPRRVVRKPRYRRVLQYGAWWELRFDEKSDDRATFIDRSDTDSIYLQIASASCGFCKNPPGLLDDFPKVVHGTADRDIRIEVKERVIVVKQHQLRLEVYRLSQINAPNAVPSLEEAAPSAEIHCDRKLNAILVLGFPDDHKAIDEAIARLRAGRKK